MGWFSKEPELLFDGANYTKVRELIVGARQRLIIISPYFDPSEDFVRQLEAASLDRRVETVVAFRRDQLQTYRNAGWCRRLAAAKIRLGTIDRLHSKIYCSESMAIVSSMNFYASSGENSFEAGIIFDAEHKLYAQLRDYVAGLDRHIEWLSSALNAHVPTHGGASRGTPARSSAKDDGFCIACGDQIPFDPEKPFCWSCFKRWDKDKAATQKYCVSCGNSARTSFEKPRCYDCFRSQS